MEFIYVILISAMIFVLVILWLFEFFLVRPHKTSKILNALFSHFRERNEKPVEFRILESMAKQSKRRFEVKTIQQKYYTVVIKGLKVLSTDAIGSFTIPEESSYMRGVIDPILLDRFEISFKEFN
ncbi:hypothetical protein EHV15_35315 [Paenibacillus oralis]|uniref:Uncharacterized protein n=1 Tax=Paenibacillus oralis TaxID=2490856 RepID=A0A3P3T9V5_9BACL|nr:hypothetical protein [Paenibacillus oralis]RRJ54845.1 hypothetical protein EHV15_35315 [Paenibacillus oralis]